MTKSRLLVLGFLAALTLSSTPARASTNFPQCDLSLVGFNSDSTGTNIYMSCSNDTHIYAAYIAGGTGNPGCGTVTIDAVKLFHSIAVGSRMAGRKVDIWWNTCTGSTGTRAIASITF